MVRSIEEPARSVPVIGEYDICVIGGSCTGVFAAVRAARLGAKVAVVEKQNSFGGVATNGLVCVWHSTRDTEHNNEIIAGLSVEVVERLKKRNAVLMADKSADRGCTFNPQELKIELDELVTEHEVTPYLHTLYTAPHVEDGKLRGIFVENKGGRGVILAKVFIDASGDGDLAAHLDLPFTVDPHLQPPTTTALIRGLRKPDLDIKDLVREHEKEFGLERDQGWSTYIPNEDDICMLAETHVFDVDPADPGDLTNAEINGRRQIRAIMDIFRKYGPQKDDMTLLTLASYIGIRETRIFSADYQLTEEDVLHGRRFPDAIANGSYRVDIHHPEGGGYIFRYLNGRQVDHAAGKSEWSRWREETDEDPTFYQIPYRCMVTKKVDNLIMAGRMISADKGAFGAIRVMINLNQTGEAAGVAAWQSIQAGRPVHAIDTAQLRDTLAEGGSVIL